MIRRVRVHIPDGKYCNEQFLTCVFLSADWEGQWSCLLYHQDLAEEQTTPRHVAAVKCLKCLKIAQRHEKGESNV
jgi:hypothetical protein